METACHYKLPPVDLLLAPLSRCFCGCSSCCSRSVPTIYKKYFIRVFVVMNFVNTGSGKVTNRYRLVVVSHQRPCISVRPYQDRQSGGCAGWNSLSEVDIESPDIIPVTKSMVGQFQRYIFCPDGYSHRRKGIKVCPSDGWEQKRKSSKKIRPHNYLLSYLSPIIVASVSPTSVGSISGISPISGRAINISIYSLNIRINNRNRIRQFALDAVYITLQRLKSGS